MSTPVSEYNKCIREGGGNTGYKFCHARVICGAEPEIDDEEGFGSVTRNGVGDYILSFDEGYSSPPHGWAVAEGGTGAYTVKLHSRPTTDSMRIQCFNSSGSLADPTAIHAFALGA